MLGSQVLRWATGGCRAMGDGGLRHSGQARCCCCCAHGLPSCSALSPCSVQPLPSRFLQRPLLLFRVLHAPPPLSLPHHSSSSILVLPLPPPLPYLAVPRPASLVSLSRSDAKLSELLLTTDIELTIFLYGFDRSL